VTLIESVTAFTFAAALLTVTPGLDTAMVLRTIASEGSVRAFLAALGVGLGCLAWGVAVAAGLGVLLDASSIAYELLRWAGAGYLAYLGVRLFLSPRDGLEIGDAAASVSPQTNWLLRGFLTNILNPKVGVFYVSFLPQFIPAEANVASMAILLTGIHAALGVAWFSIMIASTQPILRYLRKPRVIRWLDRVTGAVFIGFGLKLAVSTRH
jgi:threonine/homoserine/homoserine lactone efflux protein